MGTFWFFSEYQEFDGSLEVEGASTKFTLEWIRLLIVTLMEKSNFNIGRSMSWNKKVNQM